MVTQLLTKNKNSNIILGNGIIAYATYNVLSNYFIYGDKTKCTHTTIGSTWRENAILYNKGFGGLSKYYHGVTPATVLLEKNNEKALSSLGLKIEMDIKLKNFNFVPWKVPRPKIRKKNILPIEDFYFNEHRKNNIFLCLSTLGNLTFLKENQLIEEAQITDDLVFKIGKISNYEIIEKKLQSKIKNQGVFSPYIRSKLGLISFRPVFKTETSINFINFKENLKQSPGIHIIIEKIRRAIYLRYGILTGKVKHWECFIQVPVKASYQLTDHGLFETNSTKETYNEIAKKIDREISDIGLSSFKKKLGEVIPGIHLSYDRKILKDLPRNIIVLDTSLNDDIYLHPTLASYCKAYNIVSKFQENFL